MASVRHLAVAGVLVPAGSAVSLGLADALVLVLGNPAAATAAELSRLLVVYLITAAGAAVAASALHVAWLVRVRGYVWAGVVTGACWVAVPALVTVAALNASILQRASSSVAALANVLLVACFAMLFLGVGRAFSTPERRRYAPLLSWTPAAALIVALSGVAALQQVPRPAPPGASESAPARLPSIIFILIDTLRADHLSAYGYERRTSPTIDALAEGGVRFARAYAQSSWTRPSTASIFTSLNPSQHNTNILGDRLPDAALTLAEYVQEFGYSTAAFSANGNVSAEFGFAQGFDYFWSVRPPLLSAASPLVRLYTEAFPGVQAWLSHGRRGLDAPGAADRYLTEAALELTRDLRGPLFLYAHYIAPHVDYRAPGAYHAAFHSGSGGELPIRHPRPGRTVFHAAEPLPEAKRQGLLAAYDGEILYVDSLVRRLLDGLERRGHLDDAIVVITSDHGEEFYDHGNWSHGHSLYREVLQVPLIIRYPGVLPAGSIPEAPARLIDLFPTLVELAGLPAPSGVMGESLVPSITGAQPRAEPLVYSEIVSRGFSSQALQHGARKYVRSEHRSLRRSELYDVDADPLERADLLSGNPALEHAYESLLAQLEPRLTGGELRAEPVELGGETRRELRALGYFE